MLFQVQTFLQEFCNGFVPKQTAISLTWEYTSKCKALAVAASICSMNQSAAFLLYCQEGYYYAYAYAYAYAHYYYYDYYYYY
jgi:hypothetical protein